MNALDWFWFIISSSLQILGLAIVLTTVRYRKLTDAVALRSHLDNEMDPMVKVTAYAFAVCNLVGPSEYLSLTVAIGLIYGTSILLITAFGAIFSWWADYAPKSDEA